MPTRKQRRRKAKTFRHEFDFVTYDEEGNEVEVDPTELRAAKAKESPKKGAKGGKGSSRSARPVREVQPPSWERALKRGGLMGGGLIAIFIVFLKAPVVLGVIYGLAMIPMTYWLDRFAYRNYLRKQEKS